MTTTTVTGSGRRASIRQPEVQAPVKTSSSQSMNSPVDKFPPFHDELYDTVKTREPQHPASIIYTPGDRWEPRKASYVPQESRNDLSRISRHKPRKSISEAISTIRTRNGSVSANAQELAQALGAPVSYKLIVSLITTIFNCIPVNFV